MNESSIVKPPANSINCRCAKADDGRQMMDGIGIIVTKAQTAKIQKDRHFSFNETALYQPYIMVSRKVTIL